MANPNWPLTAKINNQGHFEIGGCSVTSLAKEFGTPLYIICEQTVMEKCREYKTSFRSKYPNTEIIYASKALCTTGLLKIIESEGLGLDISSGGELYTALKAECNPKGMYLHGNNKLKKEIEEALEAGVHRFVVDNLIELKNLDELTIKGGIRADILFRVNPGIEAHTHECLQTGRIDSKFGLGKEQILEAVREADKMKNINFRGLHAHIGSQILDTKPYELLVDVLLTISSEIFAKTKFEVEEIDIGGGLGITYLDEVSPSISALAQTVIKALLEGLKKYDIPQPKLIVEPGRSIVGTAGVTLYTAGAIKDIPGVRKYVMVDGGMGDNIRPMLYGAKYDAIVGNKASLPKKEVVTIAGRFCDGGDILIKDINLPRVEPGDIIVVLSTGAYCYSMASNYNRVERPAMVIVGSGDANLIIKRETYEDLVMNDVVI